MLSPKSLLLLLICIIVIFSIIMIVVISMVTDTRAREPQRLLRPESLRPGWTSLLRWEAAPRDQDAGQIQSQI